jgi:Ca-activated chloride channel family protein
MRGADQLMVSTFRNPRPSQPAPDVMKPAKPSGPEPGFFLAQTLIAQPAAAAVDTAPRDVVLLLDTSLSMQWDKLERSYAALEATLRSLKPTDQFSLLCFNQDVTPFQPQPVAATRRECAEGAGVCAGEQAARRNGSGQSAERWAGTGEGANASLYVFTDGTLTVA